MQKNIKRLQSVIIKKLAWGNPSNWHSSMFTELSELIFTKTTVRLSATTLKRFFNVISHKGVPSITTLDALSKFVDAENWREFRTKNTSNEPLSMKRGLTIGLVFLLMGVLFILNAYRSPEIYLESKDVAFTSKVLTKSYPNSVVFDFDIGDKKYQNILIQQYWDKTKTVNLNPGQKQATGIYYYPGYFLARLIINENTISKHELFLKSNGWIGTIDYDPIPSYFQPISTKNSILTLPNQTDQEVKSLDEPIWSTYHNIANFGTVSADNFTLKANLQNTYNDKWAVCQHAKIYILGKKGAMIIPTGKLGCSSEFGIKINELYLDGKQHDLSALASDISNPSEFDITVQNKVLRISINGKSVFTKEYAEQLGEFVGVRFKFLGAGKVNSVLVTDDKGREIKLGGLSSSKSSLVSEVK